MNDAPPSKIADYPIEEFYKRGGMSLLYLADHPSREGHLIVKILREEYLGRPEIVELFLNEAEILSSLNHPNIVKLFSHGEWEGGFFIAMELIQGKSLHEHIGKTARSLKKNLEIILEIGYALAYLHAQGIAHLDLKPENVLFTDDSTIKLIDFGAAKVVGDEMESQKERYKLVGTPIYMSPEQISAKEPVSFPSDIYSFGIIAYELILGSLSRGKLTIALLPQGLQLIISKALQPKAEDRYGTVVEMIRDLVDYMNSTAIHRETKPLDRLSDIAEKLMELQQEAIAPSKMITLQGIDLGIVSYHSHEMVGVYHDFFSLSEQENVVTFIQPLASEAESIVLAAMVKGMVRTLIQLTRDPLNIVTFLNEVLAVDYPNKLFSALFLHLDSVRGEYRYMGCGNSHLWHLLPDQSFPRRIEPAHPALGVNRYTDFQTRLLPWNKGEQLLIHTHSEQLNSHQSVLFEDSHWKKWWSNNTDASSQVYLEKFLRRLRLLSTPKIDHSLILLALKLQESPKSLGNK